MALSIITPSIAGLCHCAKFHNAQCHILFILMLNVNMLSLVVLNAIMISVVILSVVAPLNVPSFLSSK